MTGELNPRSRLTHNTNLCCIFARLLIFRSMRQELAGEGFTHIDQCIYDVLTDEGRCLRMNRYGAATRRCR